MQCNYSSVSRASLQENGGLIESGWRLSGVFAENVRKWRNRRISTVGKPPLAAFSGATLLKYQGNNFQEPGIYKQEQGNAEQSQRSQSYEAQAPKI
jgi:hypothetical protein